MHLTDIINSHERLPTVSDLPNGFLPYPPLLTRFDQINRHPPNPINSENIAMTISHLPSNPFFLVNVLSETLIMLSGSAYCTSSRQTPPSASLHTWQTIFVTESRRALSLRIVNNEPCSLHDIETHLNLLYVRNNQGSYPEKDLQMVTDYLSPLYQLTCSIEEGATTTIDQKPFLVAIMSRALYCHFRYTQYLRLLGIDKNSIKNQIANTLHASNSSLFHAIIRRALDIIVNVNPPNIFHFQAFKNVIIKNLATTTHINVNLDEYAVIFPSKEYILTGKGLSELQESTSKKRAARAQSPEEEEEEHPRKRAAREATLSTHATPSPTLIRPYKQNDT